MVKRLHPVFMRLSQGEYKSQFLINLLQLQTITQQTWRQLTTPKEVLDWSECRLNAAGNASDWFRERDYPEELTFDQYLSDQCGPDPAKD